MPDLKVISGAGNDEPELNLYFNRADATDLVKRYRGVDVAPKTWANWSWEGRGPRWRRFGRSSVAQGRDILAAIVAAVALAIFILVVDHVSPKTFPPLDFVPGFWFVVGLLVVGAAASFVGQIVAAGIGGILSGDLGGMLVIPASAIFGFIPLFMYGAWLGAQIKGG